MPEIYRAMLSYRAALLKRDQNAARRLVQSYGASYKRISAKQSKLLSEIEKAQSAGEEIGPTWLFRRERYFVLLRQVDAEINKFSEYAESVITANQLGAAKQAVRDTSALIKPEAAELGVDFNKLSTQTVENMAGALGDGSPLNKILGRLAPDAKRIVNQGLMNGIIEGRNPKAIAKEIEYGLNRNLTRALTIARTETNRAYRETAHQTYNENDDVLDGWYWVAAKSERTCNACLALDGTFHPLSERMSSHPNCRCVAAPGIKGQTLEYETGSEWFAKQSAAKQREMLGSEAIYDAYRSGKIELSDLVGKKNNPVWGAQYYVLPVDKALAGANQFPSPPERVRTPAQPIEINPPINVDPLQRFDRLPNVKIEYEDPRSDEAAIKARFPDISPKQWAALAGARDGSIVELRSHGSDAHAGVTMVVRHPSIVSQRRSIYRDPDGTMIMENEIFKLTDTGKGQGSDAFASQVHWARKMGIEKIETTAVRDDAEGYNGYYTWPRLGYDGKLTAFRKGQLPQWLKDKKPQTVRDLFDIEGGKEWWKESGGSVNMEFDLREGSRSLEVLRNYLKEKEAMKKK